METLIGVLAFGTLGIVLAFAWRSQVMTDKRRHEATPKSTLAADAPNSTPPGQRPVDT
jgi:hypothetical protein